MRVEIEVASCRMKLGFVEMLDEDGHVVGIANPDVIKNTSDVSALAGVSIQGPRRRAEPRETPDPEST